MQADVAIIGGTGIGERLRSLGGEPFTTNTRFGDLSGVRVEHQGLAIVLISRHSSGHKVPPHKVNYRAMAAGLAGLKVRGCFASAAVGGLRPEWRPGTLVACSDFLDFTNRQLTMFDDEVVHTDFTHPFSPELRDSLIEEGNEMVEPTGVYVCTNGPRYETPHEIKMYRQLGGDVIGMTAATEAILMCEAGVPYACLAIVTNAAAGMSGEALSHEEVVEEMERTGQSAVQILLTAAHHIA